MKSQRSNWWLDAIVFFGFIVSFLLDITGLEFHQWIGILVGVFLVIHLLRHLDWVTTVFSRFSGSTSAGVILNLMIDAGIGIGFCLIIFTGLIISSWLNLAFIEYSAWKFIHILTSVLTLFAVLLKIFLHRKWIVCVAEKYIFHQEPGTNIIKNGNLQPVAARVNRREFLKVSVLLSAGTFIGLSQIHDLVEEAISEKVSVSSITSTAGNSSQTLIEEQPYITPSVQETVKPTAIAAKSSQSKTACSVRCPRGCSFPGRCRRYVDSNDNGKCDLGECI